MLPTYASIGVGAATLLVLARCLQGIAAGGELGGAASFVAEYAPDRSADLLCAFVQTGALAGSLLASLVVTILFTVLGDDTDERLGLAHPVPSSPCRWAWSA